MAEFEYPDEAGYPDGKGFLSETDVSVVAEAGAPEPETPGIDVYVVDDSDAGRYEAISGDTLVGYLGYAVRGDTVALVTTSVFPEFRGQGVAHALIRQVLDRLRAGGRPITVECSAVAAFIDQHPEYQESSSGSP